MEVTREVGWVFAALVLNRAMVNSPEFLGVSEGARSERWVPEFRGGDGLFQMLYPIELHRPEVDDGTRTRNRLIQ